MLPYGYLQRLDDRLHPYPPPRPRTRRTKKLQALFFVMFISFIVSLYLIPANVVRLRKLSLHNRRVHQERMAAVRAKQNSRFDVWKEDVVVVRPFELGRRNGKEDEVPGWADAERLQRRGGAVDMDPTESNEEKADDRQSRLRRWMKKMRRHGVEPTLPPRQQVFLRERQEYRKYHVQTEKEPRTIDGVEERGTTWNDRTRPRGDALAVPDTVCRHRNVYREVAAIVSKQDGGKVVDGAVAVTVVPPHTSTNYTGRAAWMGQSFFFSDTPILYRDRSETNKVQLKRNVRRFKAFGFPRFAEMAHVVESADSSHTDQHATGHNRQRDPEGIGGDGGVRLLKYQIPRKLWKRFGREGQDLEAAQRQKQSSPPSPGGGGDTGDAGKREGMCASGMMATRFTRQELIHFNRQLQAVLFATDTFHYAFLSEVVRMEAEPQMLQRWAVFGKGEQDTKEDQKDDSETAAAGEDVLLQWRQHGGPIHERNIQKRVDWFRQIVVSEGLRMRVQVEHERANIQRDPFAGDDSLQSITKWREILQLGLEIASASYLGTSMSAVHFPEGLNVSPKAATSLETFLNALTMDQRFASSRATSLDPNANESTGANDQNQQRWQSNGMNQEQKPQGESKTPTWVWAEANPLHRIENALKEVLLRIIIAHGVGSSRLFSGADYGASHLRANEVTSAILASTERLLSLVLFHRAFQPIPEAHSDANANANKTGARSGRKRLIMRQTNADLVTLRRRMGVYPLFSTVGGTANSSSQASKQKLLPPQTEVLSLPDLLTGMEGWCRREIALLDYLRSSDKSTMLRADVSMDMYLVERFIPHMSLATLLRYRHHLDTLVRYIVGKLAYNELLMDTAKRGKADIQVQKNDMDTLLHGWSVEDEKEEDNVLSGPLATVLKWNERVGGGTVGDAALRSTATDERNTIPFARLFSKGQISPVSGAVEMTASQCPKGPVQFMSETGEEVLPLPPIAVSQETAMTYYIRQRGGARGVGSSEEQEAWERRIAGRIDDSHPLSLMRFLVVGERDPFESLTCGAPLRSAHPFLRTASERNLGRVNPLLQMRAALSESEFAGAKLQLLEWEMDEDIRMLQVHPDKMMTTKSLEVPLLRLLGFGPRSLFRGYTHLNRNADYARDDEDFGGNNVAFRSKISATRLTNGGGLWCSCEVGTGSSRWAASIPLRLALLKRESVRDAERSELDALRMRAEERDGTREMGALKSNVQLRKELEEMVLARSTGAEQDGGVQTRHLKHNLRSHQQGNNAGNDHWKYMNVPNAYGGRPREEEGSTHTCQDACAQFTFRFFSFRGALAVKG